MTKCKFPISILTLCLAQTAYGGADIVACVADAAGLETALLASITNGASTDTIKVKIGTYVAASNPFGAGGAFANGDTITIEGGWSGTPGNCQTPAISAWPRAHH